MDTARTIRTAPALLLAVAVVLVSVAGSATAARLVTGKQVKNGSLTSIDVRNNNLTGTDLKNSTVTGADLKNRTVTGADLADGAVGEDQIDPDARTYAFNQQRGDLDLLNCPDQTLSVCANVVSMIPNGPQAITVTGTLDNAENQVPTPTRCGLVHDGVALTTVRFAPDADGQPGDLVPFTLQTVVDIPAGDQVHLRCTQFAGDDLSLLGVGTQSVAVTTPLF